MCQSNRPRHGVRTKGRRVNASRAAITITTSCLSRKTPPTAGERRSQQDRLLQKSSKHCCALPCTAPATSYTQKQWCCVAVAGPAKLHTDRNRTRSTYFGKEEIRGYGCVLVGWFPASCFQSNQINPGHGTRPEEVFTLNHPNRSRTSVGDKTTRVLRQGYSLGDKTPHRNNACRTRQPYRK